MFDNLLLAHGISVEKRRKSELLPLMFQDQSSSTAIQTNDRTLMKSYEVVSWINMGVRAIARNGAKLPLKVMKKDRNGHEEEVTQDQRVRVFNRPFPPYISTKRLISWTLTSLHLTGKAFWEVQPSLRHPEFIYPVRSDLMKPIPDKDGVVRNFLFDYKGKKKILSAKNVFWVSFINPLDELDGLSPLAAGALAAATDVTAVRMNLALLNNQARPQGVFVSQDELSTPAFKRMKEQIASTHQGAWNAGKPLLLEAGVDYKAISLPPKDMEYLNGRKFSMQEILALLGVPLSVAGAPNANFATARIEERRFWEQTIEPVMMDLAGAIDAAFFPSEEITAHFDMSSIAALQAEESEKDKRLKIRFVHGIITLDEWRVCVGLEPIGGSIGKTRVLQKNLQPIIDSGLMEAGSQDIDALTRQATDLLSQISQQDFEGEVISII